MFCKMEFGCLWLVLCFSALVRGYTPTFRNEATHPLKAPTESTLGLQMNDESAGQTKSNTPKQETYVSGGKHFEYLLLNDSNVLLTSLQNDGPFEVPPQQTQSSKDDYRAKSSVSSNDTVHASSKSTMNANRTDTLAVVTSMRTNGTTRPSSHLASGVHCSHEVHENRSESNAVNRNDNPAPPIYTNAVHNLDKLPDISSTTKLYSKHPNKSDENFASFTSPVAAKPMASVYNYEDVSLSWQGRANNSNSPRTNYDYDDSFTRLLISNGILKPENVTTSKQLVEEDTGPGPGPEPAYRPRVFRGDYPNADANPSIEDINRIMDGSIVGLIRNNTDSSKSINSSRSKTSATDQGAVPKPNAKIMSETTATPFKSAVNKIISKLRLVPSTTENVKFTRAVTNPPISRTILTTNGSSVDHDQVELNGDNFAEVTTTRQPWTAAAATTANVSDSDGDGKLLYSAPKQPKDIAVTSLYEPSSSQFENADTDVPTIAITEQHTKTNGEKSLSSKRDEWTEGEPVLPFGELVRASGDLSNENPLSIRSYTDSSGSSVSEQSVFPDTVVLDGLANSKSAKDTSIGITTTHPPTLLKSSVGRKGGDGHPSRNIVPLAHFYSFGNLKASSHEIEKKNYHDSKKQGRNISVGEFKTLIEQSVRSLFFPVAQYFSHHQERVRKNGSAGRAKNFEHLDLRDAKEVKVTLKRFGLANVMELSKGKWQDERSASRVDRDLGLGRAPNRPLGWTDLNDGRSVNLDERVDELFAEDDGDDDVHWFVLLLAGNSTIARVRNEDFVKYLKVNLAARLSLEYNDVKINAVIMVPPNLAVNVSLPANESSIDVNEELDVERTQRTGAIHELAETNATLLELSGQEYRVLQLLSLKSQPAAAPGQPADEGRRIVDTKHDDVELYIFVFLGAICTFGVLSPLLYGVYRLIQNHTGELTFKVPAIFGDKFQYQHGHEKMSESRCESLNVIFSEDFDRKYSSSSPSWFDNSQHSSSILKSSADAPASFFGDRGDDYAEFSDFARNAVESSPRLNKENKLNMLGCRPSCVLLPHPTAYLMRGENEERYFDNPNYNQDGR